MALTPEQASGLFANAPKAEATLKPEDADALFASAPKAQPTFSEAEAMDKFGGVPFKEVSPGEFKTGRGAATMAGATGVGSGLLESVSNPFRNAMSALTGKPAEDMSVDIGGFNLNKKADDLREQSSDYREIADLYTPGNPWTKFGTQGIDALLFMGPSVATSYITKKPNFALGVMGTQVFGETYSRSRDEKKSIDESIEDAMMATLTEILPEKAFGVFDNLVVGKSIKQFIKTAITEGFSEGGTSGLQIWDETARQGKKLPPIEKILKRIGYDSAMGVFIGGGIAAPSLLGKAQTPTFDPLKVGATTPQQGIGPLPNDALEVFGAPAPEQAAAPEQAQTLFGEPVAPEQPSMAGLSPIIQLAQQALAGQQTPVEPTAAPVEPPAPPEEQQSFAEPPEGEQAAFQQGNKAQAVRMKDGTWRVRYRALVSNPWSQWEARETFDPSPTFGFKPLTSATGTMRIPGEGIVIIGKHDVNRTDGPKPPPDLLEGIAKGIGLDRAAWAKAGVDPAEFTRRFGIRYLFRKKGGMTPDRVREMMQEGGGEFLPVDDPNAVSTVTDDDAVNLVMRALGGERIIGQSDQEAEDAYENYQREIAELEEMERFAQEIGKDLGIEFRPEDYPEVSEYYRALAELAEENQSEGEFTAAAEEYFNAIDEATETATGAESVEGQAAAPEPKTEKTEAGDQIILGVPEPGEATPAPVEPPPDETRPTPAESPIPASSGPGDLFGGNTPGERPEQGALLGGEENTPGTGPETKAKSKYAQPNEHGVYSREDSEEFVFDAGGKQSVKAKIRVLQISEKEWIFATDYEGRNEGTFSPLKVYTSATGSTNIWNSREDALNMAARELLSRAADPIANDDAPKWEKDGAKKLTEWASQYVIEDEFFKRIETPKKPKAKAKKKKKKISHKKETDKINDILQTLKLRKGFEIQRAVELLETSLDEIEGGNMRNAADDLILAETYVKGFKAASVLRKHLLKTAETLYPTKETEKLEEAPAEKQTRSGSPEFNRLSSTLRPSLWLDIWSDNGFNAERAVNWPLKRQVKTAKRLLKERFGFRVIEIDRRMNLNEAMDQIQDAYRNMQFMAHVYNLPVTSMGLDGTLKLTLEKNAGYLGAYSSGNVEILMPGRSNSFAHEWGHALDYHLLRRIQGLTDESFSGLSGRVRSDGVEPEPNTVEEAFVSLMDNLFFDQSILAADIMGWELQAVNGTARQKKQAEQKLKEAREGKLKTRKNRSRYFRTARDYGSPKYWNKPTEMLARAFEAYTALRVMEVGGSSEFITKSDENYLNDIEDRLAKTFPKLEERARIFAAFDRLFELVASENIFPGNAAIHPGEGNRVDPRDYDSRPNDDNLLDIKSFRSIISDIKSARIRLMEGLQDKPKHPEAWYRRIDSWRSFMADTMKSRARTLEKMYPQSRAMKTLFNHVLTAPGEGAAVNDDIKAWITGNVIAQKTVGRTVTETVHEETIRRFFTAMRRFDGIMRNHGLEQITKEENVILRELLLGNEVTAPDNIVKAAAAIRAILKDAYYDFKSVGIDMGVVTDKGYLTRTYNEAKILESTESAEAFKKDARELFEEHQFPHEYGLDDATPDEYPGIISESRDLIERFVRNARFYSVKGMRNQHVIDALGKAQKEISKLKKKIIKAQEEGEDIDGFVEEIKEIYADLVNDTWNEVASDYAWIKADEWYHAIATPNVEDYFVHVAQPGAPILKGRKLVGQADDIMKDWLETDVATIIERYSRSASRKIAHVNHFGAKNEILERLKNQMSDEGVHKSHIDQALSLVAQVNGHVKHGIGRHGQSMTDWIHTIGYIALLGRAVISSLAEPGAYAIRTGNLKHAFAPLMMTIQGITRSKNAKDLKELAYAMNVIGHRATSAVLQNQLGGQYTMSPKAGKLMQMFFDATLLTRLTEAQRAYGVGVSYEFLRKQSQDWIGNKDRANAEAQFRELGIENFEEFSTWLLESNEMPRPDELYESDGRASPRGHQFMLATQRFVDQTIQNPDTSLRPELAHNPIGRLLYGIMAFSYAFYENLIKREAKMLIRKKNPDAVKYFIAHTFPAFAALGISQVIVSTMRELLLNADKYEDMDDDEKAKKLLAIGLNRAYGYGGLDPLLQYVYGLKYNRSLAEQAVGAAPGWLLSNTDKVAGYYSPRNSEKTTTAEYRAAEGLYELSVVPAANIFFSATSTIPGLRIPSSVGIYMSRTFREEIASLFGSRPDYTDEVDKKYSAVKGEIYQKFAEISDRLRELPKNQWKKEFKAIKQEYPDLLEGVDLKSYKLIDKSGKVLTQNVIEGKAGRPITDKSGKPQFKNKNEALKNDAQVTAANKAIKLIIDDRKMTYGTLYGIEPGLSETLDKIRDQREASARVSRGVIADVRKEIEKKRRSIKRELTKELRRINPEN